MQKRSRRSPIRNRGDFMLLSLLLHPAPSRDSHYEKLTNTPTTGCGLALTSAEDDRSPSRNLTRKSPVSTWCLAAAFLLRVQLFRHDIVCDVQSWPLCLRLPLPLPSWRVSVGWHSYMRCRCRAVSSRWGHARGCPPAGCVLGLFASPAKGGQVCRSYAGRGAEA